MNNIQNKSLLLLLIFSFCACDPEYCLRAIVKNETSIDLEVNFVSEEVEDFREVIPKGKSITYISDGSCGLGKVGFLLEEFDSIYISSNSSILKAYYPDDVGRNIYKTTDTNIWKLRYDDNVMEYTFTIKEEDIFDTTPKE